MIRLSLKEAKRIGIVICKDCGTSCTRTGPSQSFCRECSTKRNLKRQRKWASDNPPSSEYTRQIDARRRAELQSVGKRASSENARGIAWLDRPAPDLAWIVRVALPFNYALSKNHAWANTSQGHVYLREEHRREREVIADAIRKAVANVSVVENRVWLDVLVQKPNHKGDAMNVLDGLCDALKVALGVDDRWFCIRRLDWEIVKESPRIFIGIGQEHVGHARVCSYCGRILALTEFKNHKGDRLGVGRECKECLHDRRKAIRDATFPRTMIEAEAVGKK